MDRTASVRRCVLALSLGIAACGRTSPTAHALSREARSPAATARPPSRQSARAPSGTLTTGTGDIAIPIAYRDPRIEPHAIPEEAGDGLSESDVLLLWRGAKFLLDHGLCTSVEYADKSTGYPGKYFVQQGNRNVYFTEADLGS